MATRYDEMNCNGGCEACNCFDLNHQDKYYDALVKKFGYHELANLHLKSQELQKFMRHELEEIIETYNQT